eukprot:478642-Ditylum_brightwellii.AAC.1
MGWYYWFCKNTSSATLSSSKNTNKEGPSCPAYLMKPRLCNEDVEHLLKAYCCHLHRANGHSLLQCDFLLRYFSISLKDGVDLSKPLKTQPSACLVASAPIPLALPAQPPVHLLTATSPTNHFPQPVCVPYGYFMPGHTPVQPVL